MSHNIGATSYDYDDPPPPYSSMIPSAPPIENGCQPRFPTAATNGDLHSVVMKLEKKLEICEKKIQSNEKEIETLKAEHTREISKLREQILDMTLQRASDSPSSCNRSSNVATPPLSCSRRSNIAPPVYSFPSSKIALLGSIHRFVTALPNGEPACRRGYIGISETIVVEEASEAQFAYLRSCHGKYLGAHPEGELKWDKKKEESCTLFEVHHVEGDVIGLKSCNGKWVAVDKYGQMSANQSELNYLGHFTVYASPHNNGS